MNAAPETKTWEECLEAVMSGPGHKPDYRKLCGEDHPQHAAWRARMCAKLGVASSPAAQTPAATMPSLLHQARNVAGAMGRVVAAAARGEKIQVGEEEQTRRLAICQACEFLVGDRCSKCGCIGRWKGRLATEHCPLNPPKW